MKEESNIEKNWKDTSLIEKNLKTALDTEEKLKTEPIVKESPKTKSINKVNLKENAVFNKNIQEKVNYLNVKKTTILNESFNFKETSNNFEDFESNCSSDSDQTPCKSSRRLIKVMTKTSSRKFYSTMKKETSDHDLIDRILKDRYSRMSRIFDEPAKSVPLPRRNGTINITFSKRIFPTPARESVYAEEQEVCYNNTQHTYIYISLLNFNVFNAHYVFCS